MTEEELRKKADTVVFFAKEKWMLGYDEETSFVKLGTELYISGYRERDEEVYGLQELLKKTARGFFHLMNTYKLRWKPEIEKLREENEKLHKVAGVAKWAHSVLDAIKYELECSVYTLTDDDFEKVFLVRDNLSDALKELEG